MRYTNTSCATASNSAQVHVLCSCVYNPFPYSNPKRVGISLRSKKLKLKKKSSSASLKIYVLD